MHHHAMISRIISQTIVIVAVITTLTYTAVGQQSTNISKADVQAVLDSIDKACLKKDAAAVVANYASNAVITVTFDGSDPISESAKYDSLDAFKGDLELGFVAYENYRVKRKEISIKIASNGKTAQCNFTQIAKYKFRGKREKDIIRESMSLALLDGKVLVTKDHSDMKTTQ